MFCFLPVRDHSQHKHKPRSKKNPKSGSRSGTSEEVISFSLKCILFSQERYWMEYFWYTLTFFCAVVQHRWSVFPPPVQLYLRGRLDTNYAFMLTVVESLFLSCLWQKLCIGVIGWLSHIRSSSFFVSASLSMNALFQLPKKQIHYHKSPATSYWCI